jgi:electron transport complex protein RnfD
MSEKLIVSSSPHQFGNETTSLIMRDVVIALIPALALGTWIFGLRALLMALFCIAVSVLSEFLFERLTGRPITIGDFSAVVTGLLLALNLPVGLPFWMAGFGCVVAIIVVKQLFGGIGKNFANPAITARIIMLISFTGPMTTWAVPGVDTVSAATPLASLSAGQTPPVLLDLFLGLHLGSIGETSSAALLLGGAYLLHKKIISWHTPVAFVATVFALTALFGAQPLHQMFSGGLMLGAIYMATDYSTSPSTASGKIIFGIGCGIFTALIRVFGSYPEGVSFAILLMNIATPHISNLTASKPLGGLKV